MNFFCEGVSICFLLKYFFFECHLPVTAPVVETFFFGDQDLGRMTQENIFNAIDTARDGMITEELQLKTCFVDFHLVLLDFSA